MVKTLLGCRKYFKGIQKFIEDVYKRQEEPEYYKNIEGVVDFPEVFH